MAQSSVDKVIAAGIFSFLYRDKTYFEVEQKSHRTALKRGAVHNIRRLL